MSAGSNVNGGGGGEGISCALSSAIERGEENLELARPLRRIGSPANVC